MLFDHTKGYLEGTATGYANAVRFYSVVPIFEASDVCLTYVKACSACQERNRDIGWGIRESETACTGIGLRRRVIERLPLQAMYECDSEYRSLYWRGAEPPPPEIVESFNDAFQKEGLHIADAIKLKN